MESPLNLPLILDETGKGKIIVKNRFICGLNLAICFRNCLLITLEKKQQKNLVNTK